MFDELFSRLNPSAAIALPPMATGRPAPKVKNERMAPPIAAAPPIPVSTPPITLFRSPPLWPLTPAIKPCLFLSSVIFTVVPSAKTLTFSAIPNSSRF